MSLCLRLITVQCKIFCVVSVMPFDAIFCGLIFATSELIVGHRNFMFKSNDRTDAT